MLVVSGVGVRMVEELARRARRGLRHGLTAFAHDPAFFVRRGFSIVPAPWVPEKIAHDCNACPLFRNCGQYAMLLTARRADVMRARDRMNDVRRSLSVAG